MQVVDIIQKKVKNKPMTQKEIEFIVNGIVNKTIPDYMITSWLMAIYINHLSKKEAYYLTKSMIDHGEHIDLSNFTKAPLIDKHSTGGIGDKVTMIFGPLLASLGISVAKLSGRALGFTGGTIDKLESIGINTDLTKAQMLSQLKKVGLFVAGQTKDIAPCDKVLYNLRDITGTVIDWGLIASSILSKKFSMFGTHVFLDVKCGSGAFCADIEKANMLIDYLQYIAKAMGRKLTMVVTNMNQPLGNAIGNAVEVKEAHRFLQGHYNDYPDLKELIFNFAAIVLKAYDKSLTTLQAKAKVEGAIQTGKAVNKFYQWVESQGGDVRALKNGTFFKPKYEYEIKATKSGYLRFTSISQIGMISNHLGAGRILKTDKIDMHAGLVLWKKYGDYFNKGDTLAVCYSSKPIDKEKVTWDYFQCCKVDKKRPPKVNVIKKVVYAK